MLPLLGLLVVLGGRTGGQDWPAYMHDNSRSGVTTMSLDLPLQPAWTFRTLRPPAPAWPAPARQDFFHDHFDLRAVETYDHAFHAIAAGGAVYFGSSSQNKVYALKAESGALLWTFLTEGPVRFAPVFYDGRIYVGADDGQTYCLSAGEGSLLWKRRIASDERLVPGNGRMISLWPIRTGLVVADGTVYGTAGLFPEQGTYLAALEARTGDVKYRQPLKILPQGYMLASRQRLYIPTGRTNPVLFSRADGQAQGQLASAGGAYAVLMDDVLVSGPGRGPKELQAGDVVTNETVATFGGLRIVVTGGVAYMQSERQLAALDRGRYLVLSRERMQLLRKRDAAKKSLAKLEKNEPEAQKLQSEIESLHGQVRKLDAELKTCYLWTTPSTHSYSMIVAGKTLFVGGDNEVAAIDSEKGQTIWTGRVEGRAFGLSAASGALYVSTDTGRIHCFRHAVEAEPRIAAEEACGTSPYPQDELSQRYQEAADDILRQLPSKKGYALVLDNGEGRLAYELARRSEFQIVAVESDVDRVDKARRLLDAAGLYGRVAVHHVTGSRW